MAYIVPEAYAHERLDSEVKKIVENQGFRVISDAYHISMDPMDANVIRSVYSPAALLFRTRADAIAVNRRTGDSFYLEVKSPPSRHTLYLEALPLFAHLREQKAFDADCLYVYRGPLSDNRIIGRYVQDIIPQAAGITLTPRANKSLETSLLSMVDKYAPDLTVNYRNDVKGSGDPFFIVPGDALQIWSELPAILEARNEQD